MTNSKMKKITYFILFSISFSFSCTENKKESGKQTNSALSSADSIYNLPATITGKILNLEVYPNIKQVELTIPNFEGDEMLYTTSITTLGSLQLNFIPEQKEKYNFLRLKIFW